MPEDVDVPSEPLRFALLGAGRIGRIHAAHLAVHPGARLVSVSDTEAGAAADLAARTGAAVRDAREAVAAPDIDAVAICSPTDTHADLVESAARAGKAIFCEKPISLESARAAACVAFVRSVGAPLMIGFNRRFDPSFVAVRRRVEAGEIGDVELVTILSRDPEPPSAEYAMRSGGLFRDMMIHDFDMARFLLGEEVSEVHAVGSSLVDPAIGRAGDVDTAAVLLKTASGRIATISNSRRATYGYDQRIEVHGSRGMLTAGNRRATTVSVSGPDGTRVDPVLPFFLERYADAYRAEMDAFVAALRDGRPMSPTGEDGLAAQRIADAATQASRTGSAVSLA